MSRTKVSEEQKKKAVQRAVSKFHKEHMKVYTFRFHKENQCDIIEHLESQSNKAGYIADLIRKDLIAHGKEPFIRERVCDLIEKYHPFTALLLFKDGSKMSGNAMMFRNDERFVDTYDYNEYERSLIIHVRYS